MATDTEPTRDLELDIEDEAPLNDAGPSGPVDAPYGLKRDGTPAKKRGRPVGWRKGDSSGSSNNARARASKGSLETQIGAFLLTVNAPFMMFASTDALDVVEIQALAHAINEECNRSARFRKMVEQALSVQGGTSLVLIVAAIAGRRVVRHNLVTVPEPVGNDKADALLGQIISMSTGQGAFNPNLRVMQDQQTA